MFGETKLRIEAQEAKGRGEFFHVRLDTGWHSNSWVTENW